MLDSLSIGLIIKICVSVGLIFSITTIIVFKIKNKKSITIIFGKNKNNVINNNVSGNIKITDVTKEK